MQVSIDTIINYKKWKFSKIYILYLIFEAGEERMASSPPGSDQTLSLVSHLATPNFVHWAPRNDEKPFPRLTF